MNNKKVRTTFRRQPKIPGNTPPPIYYNNKAAQVALIRQMIRAASKR